MFTKRDLLQIFQNFITSDNPFGLSESHQSYKNSISVENCTALFLKKIREYVNGQDDDEFEGPKSIENPKKRKLVPRAVTAGKAPLRVSKSAIVPSHSRKRAKNIDVVKVKKVPSMTKSAYIQKEELEMDEDKFVKEIKKVRGASLAEVATLLEEAEKEFETMRELSMREFDVVEGSGGENMQWESAPKVQNLISSATLGNLSCLTTNNVVGLNSLDGRVSSHMWWQVARRSCMIYGVFQLLRQQKSKSFTIEQRYANLPGEGLLSFQQASRYARIGKFLCKYPMFVFQRKWLTQADWFQTVDVGLGKSKHGKKLIDYLPSILTASSVFSKR
jgi:hypothetical protein